MDIQSAPKKCDLPSIHIIVGYNSTLLMARDLCSPCPGIRLVCEGEGVSVPAGPGFMAVFVSGQS